MSTHSVGDDQKIPCPLPFLAIGGNNNREAILIVGTTHTDVAKGLSIHDRLPVARSFVC
jgi:hypothetical protein